MARKRRPNRSAPRKFEPNVGSPGWRWRTLPVWLALTGGFLIGWYVQLIAVGVQPTGWAMIVFYAVLIGFSFGLSRITGLLAARWRYRRIRRVAEREAETEAGGLSAARLRLRRMKRRSHDQPPA